jgi:hypothetical protein
MHAIAVSMEFRGYATHLSPGVLTVRASAPTADFELVEGDEALIERRLTFLDDTRFEEVGTISFGNGDALRYRSVDEGTLAPSADPALRQGTAAWKIDGGSGTLARATGRIVSNFLVSDGGELTDHEVAVLFVDDVGRQ